jgi:hypothetical protein
VLITDKLRSYAAAKREIMPGVEIGGTKASGQHATGEIE